MKKFEKNTLVPVTPFPNRVSSSEKKITNLSVKPIFYQSRVLFFYTTLTINGFAVDYSFLISQNLLVVWKTLYIENSTQAPFHCTGLVSRSLKWKISTDMAEKLSTIKTSALIMKHFKASSKSKFACPVLSCL